MVNYLKRLRFLDSRETKPVNPLIYPFLFGTLIYGLGFLLLGDWSGVSSSSLYQAMYEMNFFIPLIWGFLATVASGFALILLLRRSGWWGGIASILGWMVWLFAGIVYALEGFWMVLLTVACVYGYFWIYYYLTVKQYQRDKAKGLIKDPE